MHFIGFSHIPFFVFFLDQKTMHIMMINFFYPEAGKNMKFLVGSYEKENRKKKELLLTRQMH